MGKIEKIIEELEKKINSCEDKIHECVYRYDFSGAAAWESKKNVYKDALNVVNENK